MAGTSRNGRGVFAGWANYSGTGTPAAVFSLSCETKKAGQRHYECVLPGDCMLCTRRAQARLDELDISREGLPRLKMLKSFSAKENNVLDCLARALHHERCSYGFTVLLCCGCCKGKIALYTESRSFEMTQRTGRLDCVIRGAALLYAEFANPEKATFGNRAESMTHANFVSTEK
jgi:hypothetical protein